jgi:hypothetical protein
MDSLDIRGGLGGAAAMLVSYANHPFQVRTSDGAQRRSVVSDEAFADFGFAATFDRWRVYLDFDMPLAIGGQSGTVGDYQFTAPAVDPGSNPDTLSDTRVGFDARLFGDARDFFRLGVGAQLFMPSGRRAEYDGDGSYRGMARFLLAGDVGFFTYAGQLGAHLRPLDDSPTPGSPQGSELLFGLAGGARVPVGNAGTTAFVIGPEVFGASAFRSFLGSTSTALEGLLTARLEGAADVGPQLRVKLGSGTGIDQHFGSPAWRLVFAIELFDHGVKKGVTQARP